MAYEGLDWALHAEYEGILYDWLAPRMQAGCLDEALLALRSLKAAYLQIR